MMSRWMSIVVAMCWSMIGATVMAQSLPASPAKQVTDLFQQLDKSQDRALDQAEFVVGFADKKLATRDFHLCDWDADGKLSLNEFWTVPLVTTWEQRGPVPHPIAKIVARYFDLLVKRWPVLGKPEAGSVPRDEFLGGAARAFEVPTVPSPTIDVDADGNGAITETEARRYVEILLGAVSYTHLRAHET